LNERLRALIDWVLLTGFCAFLFFYGLGSFGLIGADEPRYAQVAREMLARHDWITPTLGGVAWLEKPALYYWEAMLSYRVFGVSDWAARVPSAVDATLMVFAVYLFLRRFRPGFHLDGALIIASAAGIIGFSRAASMDMPLATMLTIALLAWYAWSETQARQYLLLFYTFLALGTLAKGPVSPFLAAAILGLFAAAKKEFSVIRRTLWIPGIFLFLLIALPWYVLVQMRNPQFFRVFILEHNLARFGTNLYHHPEPFWYYLPVVLLGLVPWAVFVIAGLFECVRAWWSEKREMLRSEDALNAFLILWLIVPVAFFSLSQSKLPGYIVPALPAGTLLLAEYVRRHATGDERPNVLWVLLHSVVAAALLVPALMIAYILQQHHLPWNRATQVSTVLALILAAGMAITLFRVKGMRLLRFVTLIPVVLSVAALLRIGAPMLDETLSARPVWNEISRLEDASALPPLAVFGVSRETEYGLAFYGNRVVIRYEGGQVPAGTHIVVAPQSARPIMGKVLKGRRVSYLGTYWPQKLDYFWVAPVGSY
jgi:4-amino-4-deoxy-L-arabinose transferase-like glycosyltransferase